MTGHNIQLTTVLCAAALLFCCGTAAAETGLTERLVRNEVVVVGLQDAITELKNGQRETTAVLQQQLVILTEIQATARQGSVQINKLERSTTANRLEIERLKKQSVTDLGEWDVFVYMTTLSAVLVGGLATLYRRRSNDS